MQKKEIFEKDLQQIAEFGRAVSHPARLAILKYLAETKCCISGDISDSLPLSRTTVSQHLKELKTMGLIHGQIDGQRINYCLCSATIEQYLQLFNSFFDPISKQTIACAEQEEQSTATACSQPMVQE